MATSAATLEPFIKRVTDRIVPRVNAKTALPQSIPLKIPHHVAIIMDGNGRWAKKRNMPRLAGHKAGTQNLRRILRECVRQGIKVLTLYAFSTENWSRPADEVTGLMAILENVLEREIDELDANGVKICHIGRIDRVPEQLQNGIASAIERTKCNNRITLNVALNYGGRAEIVDAMKALVKSGIALENINEETIGRALYTGGIPDPELIIRTSGEQRVSNFLIWQGAYSEYYFTDTYWPDFDEKELMKALEHYNKRERRFGGVQAIK
jgi:undecaprenyl diphosphate synthase